jgi:hypothetical protein
MQFDREIFFNDYRGRFDKLKQEQVDGLNFLLDQIALDDGFSMVRQLAYVLATVRGETGNFQPRREKRALEAKQPALFKTQNRYWHTGFFGRGYVQITWERNYRKAGRELAGTKLLITDKNGNVQEVTVEEETFVQQPDLVMQPSAAYQILANGMREGWFTNRKLSDFIKEGQPPDYLRARKIINGLDRAAEFASFADKFELILRASLKSDS